jgi:putative hemolysin
MLTNPTSTGSQIQLSTRLAQTAADRAAAQRLRYQVFVAELGATGPMVDHADGREADHLDDIADHLLLEDASRPEGDRVVGVYRLMNAAQAAGAGGFYSATEFDISPLLASGKSLLELGRSCLHPDYRGGAGIFMMWAALADLIAEQGIEVLFGTASFQTTDPLSIAGPLSLLASRHSAPPDLTARSMAYHPMDLIPADQVDRKAALLDMPPLIKAYLRLGGMVGDGAFIDQAFGCIDICMILEIARIPASQRAMYERGRAL